MLISTYILAHCDIDYYAICNILCIYNTKSANYTVQYYASIQYSMTLCNHMHRLRTNTHLKPNLRSWIWISVSRPLEPPLGKRFHIESGF